MGNAAKSVTPWASRQNALNDLTHCCIRPMYNADTQSTVQTTRLCPRCEAKVKVAAPANGLFRLLVLISNVARDPGRGSLTSLPGAEADGNCALTRQKQSLTRMTTAGKTAKERNCTQMPVAKKERTNHKCWWQTKNGCTNQASKQLTPNERNKTAQTTSKTQTVAYLQA